MSPPVIRMVALIFLKGVIEGFGALRSVLVLSRGTLALALALAPYIFARSGIRRRLLLLGSHIRSLSLWRDSPTGGHNRCNWLWQVSPPRRSVLSRKAWRSVAKFVDQLRCFRFGEVGVKRFTRVLTECLEVRALGRRHGLVARLPFLGLPLKPGLRLIVLCFHRAKRQQMARQAVKWV